MIKRTELWDKLIAMQDDLARLREYPQNPATFRDFRAKANFLMEAQGVKDRLEALIIQVNEE